MQSRADEHEQKAAIDALVAALARYLHVCSSAAPAMGGPELLNAKAVGVSPRTFSAAIKAGELVGFRVGRQLMCKRRDWERYLESKRVRPNRSPASTPTNGRRSNSPNTAAILATEAHS